MMRIFCSKLVRGQESSGIWQDKVDKAELASNTLGLVAFIGIAPAPGGAGRMIWYLAWMLNYHGVCIHTCRLNIKESKNKISVQQTFGGIYLNSWSKDYPLLGWMHEKGHLWENEQGKCTHMCKFKGVDKSSRTRIYMGIIQLLEDFEKFCCLDGVLTRELVVLCGITAAQTWQLRGVLSMRARNM